jgi:hypothetical protein
MRMAYCHSSLRSDIDIETFSPDAPNNRHLKQFEQRPRTDQTAKNKQIMLDAFTCVCEDRWHLCHPEQFQHNIPENQGRIHTQQIRFQDLPSNQLCQFEPFSEATRQIQIQSDAANFEEPNSGSVPSQTVEYKLILMMNNQKVYLIQFELVSILIQM